jgi:type IV/VI secretion system ImpK/VasF family protein
MKLLDLYEDLFQYICLLNRISDARPEAHPEYARVRGEIKGMLEGIRSTAASDVRLMNQASRLELPIIFFVDNIICTSRLKFAQQWAGSRLAMEKKNELAGDERFFDFVQQDLTDPSEEAVERLAIYCTCFGLGFTGMYVTQPEKMRGLVEQIFPRIRQWTDSDRSKLSEEAYKHTDTRILTEPPNNKIILVALCFVFFSMVVLALYYGLYIKASSDLTGAIQQIADSAKR